MQTPTPPTKPTPPALPAMSNKSSRDNTTTTAPSSSAGSVSTGKSTVDSQKDSTAAASPAETTEKTAVPSADATKASPSQLPLGTSQENLSQTTFAPAAPNSQMKPSSFGFSFFFVLGLLVISLLGFYLWKNRPQKQRTILNYSPDSPQDLINLMNSSATAVPSSQAVSQKNGNSPKIKSNFEVRI